MIKNVPTVNGRAIFFGLLTIALVIVAPISHGWAQGIEPELITFTSGELALEGFMWKPEGPGPSGDFVESRQRKVSGPQEGHNFCWRGTNIWGPDVLQFIETHLKPG